MSKSKTPKLRKRKKPENHPKHEPVTLETFDQTLEAMAKTLPLTKEKK